MKEISENNKETLLRELKAHGITDTAVLNAFSAVPRHLFVGKDFQQLAYEDHPLPIGSGQTISQPSLVAQMCTELDLTPSSKVLDVGTGSGFAAAILSKLAGQVISIERIPDLAEMARQNLARIGCTNVAVICADGSRGYPDEAPYDAIHVAAGAPTIPDHLVQQLKPGGHMVIPTGMAKDAQSLKKISKTRDGLLKTESLCEVRFVPLLGSSAWPAL